METTSGAEVSTAHSPQRGSLAASATRCLADVSSAQTGSSWFPALHHDFIVGRTMMQLQYRLVARSRQVYKFPGTHRLLALCCKCSIFALTRLFLAASTERREGTFARGFSGPPEVGLGGLI